MNWYRFLLSSLFLVALFLQMGQAQACMEVKVLSLTCTGNAGAIEFVEAEILVTADEPGTWTVTSDIVGGDEYLIGEVQLVQLGFVNQIPNLVHTFSANQGEECHYEMTIPHPCQWSSCEPVLVTDVEMTDIPCENTRDGGGAVLTIDPAYAGSNVVMYLYDDQGNYWGDFPNQPGGLPRGQYFVNLGVTGTSPCDEMQPFFVEGPDLAISILREDLADGRRRYSYQPFSGEPPYSYQWEDGNTDSTRVFSTDGIYRITVSDASDCQWLDNVFYTAPICGPFTATNNPTICGGNNGSLSFYSESLQEHAEYLWSTGDTTAEITGLAPGEYALNFTLGEVCSLDTTFTVTEREGEIAELDFLEIIISCSILPEPAEVRPLIETSSYDLIASWTDESGNLLHEGLLYEPDTSGLVYLSYGIEGGATCLEDTIDFAFREHNIEFQGIVGCSPIRYRVEDGYTRFDVLLPNGSGLMDQDFFELSPSIAGWYEFSPSFIFECDIIDSFYHDPFLGSCASIAGSLYLDDNEDCSYTDNEISVREWQVRLRNTQTDEEVFAFTDASGAWEALVPAATYELSAVVAGRPFVNCGIAQEVVVEPNTFNGPFAIPMLRTLEDCPRLQMEVTVPFIRRCFPSLVHLRYRNEGNIVAEDAQIVIELHDWIESYVLPPGVVQDSVVAAVLTGDPDLLYLGLGDVPPFVGGNFSIELESVCNNDLPFGAAVCLKAYTLPHAPCPSWTEDWSGASLEVRAFCEDETNKFRIRNIGEDMTGAASYIITEDGVMFNPQPIPVLLSGQELVVEENATGATYHMLVEQVAGHPGLRQPTAFVERCSADTGEPSTFGLGLIFPPSDDAYWVDEDCVFLIGSYDPNDKNAEPQGYGDEHFISDSSAIEYTIRFQNTGTDTAFFVTIKDTLSPLLDYSTIELGASSHPVVTTIDEMGVLTFSFPDIMLPDSFVNEPASNGSVSFRIWPKADLEQGALIENTAAIYFDFNTAVITNTYYHTIGKEFIVRTSVEEWQSYGDRVLKVYPNPTFGPSWIELPPALVGESLQLRVTDLLGRSMLEYDYGASTMPAVDLSGFKPGWYSLQLYSEGQLLGVGRLLLE